MEQRWLRILLIAGAGLLAIALILFFVFRSTDLIGPQPTPRPTLPPVPVLDITPPPSLAELADEYPELADILTDPELDSCYKEFLVAYQEGGEEAALELAHERGLLTPDNDAIRVTLVLDTTDHEPLVEQLEGVGVTVVSAYQDRINLSVPVALVEAQLEAEEPGAVFEELTELDHVIAVRLPEQRAPDQSNIPGEGVDVTGADDWHAAGFTGAGVRIGVLDMGFAGRESLEGTELPAGVPLQTFGWIDEGEVHGTACAEIVHEMAPDAELIFAWYDGSDAAMGEAVDWLMSQGVNIISNSTGGVVGPRDGTGWDARLVDQVTAQGVLWVNSSGNEASSHYRAVFRDEDGDNVHEFAPGEENLALYLGRGGFQIILQWEDSWDAAGLDYDLYLYDQDGNLVGASEDYQTGQQGQEPVEGMGGTIDASLLYAAVVDAGANRDVPFDIFVQGADIGYTTPDYSVNTPGDAVGSLTVGAVNFWDDSLAYYSSQGPTADGRLKPEISAPTGVSGATYGERGFDGTSSSCPHVAGAAALVWQANPSYSRDQVVDHLLNNALDLGAAGPDTGFGYGRLQLGQPPGGAAQPMPTVTPAQGGMGTPAPDLPTPTPVAYATPAPGASTGVETGFLAMAGLLTLCVGGLGCLGTALVFFGLIGLVVRRRRARRRRPVPPPPPRAQAQVPPRPAPPRGQYRAQPPRPTPPPQAQLRCPDCGEALRPGARFCPNCGRQMG